MELKIKSTFYKYSIYTLSITLVLLLWIIGTSNLKTNLLIPTIDKTLKAFFSLITSRGTHYALFKLILSVLVGLLLGSTVGIITGILAFHFKGVYYFSKGFIVFFRTVPKISIILIIIIVFGYRLSGYISLLLIIIPIAFDTVITGLSQINSDYYDVFKLEGGDFFETLSYLYLPFLKDYIILILIQGIGFGIKVMIMSDYLILTKNSIGAKLFWARSNLEYDYVFAWTIIIIIISIIFDQILRVYKSKTAN